MREIIVDLFCTVDGFAAGERSTAYFGYGGPELQGWIDEEVAKPQVLLMGRVTYEAMAAMCRDSDDPDARRMTEQPKLVASTTLTEPLDWSGTRLLGPDVAAGLAALKESDGDPVRTIGSLTLVTTLLAGGLADRLRLVVFPQVLGETGRERILTGLPDLDLTLASSRVLDGRLVVLDYRPL